MTVEVRHGDPRIGYGGMIIEVFDDDQEGFDFADWIREDFHSDYVVEVQQW